MVRATAKKTVDEYPTLVEIKGKLPPHVFKSSASK